MQVNASAHGGQERVPWRSGEGAHAAHGSPRTEDVDDCEPL